MLPRGLLHDCERGTHLSNKQKNRYRQTIAYDRTRVKLAILPGDEFSDYINASYIDGYKAPKAYIAAQGPKSCTVADFWRMVWQENVRHIVVLADLFENGEKQFEKYWPDIDAANYYGKIKVKFLMERKFTNFDVRIFLVINRDEQRQVEQMHFTTWLDEGVPMHPHSLAYFTKHVFNIPYNSNAPILVHCSSGAGRTGAFILGDVCLRMATEESAVDFSGHAKNLCDQRASMVNDAQQYILAHLVVLECIFGMRTAIPCLGGMEQLVAKIPENDAVAQQMEYLREIEWRDSVLQPISEAVDPALTATKNRFHDIVSERHRVNLLCHPVDDPTSTYINAVLVDDFRRPGRYAVTQQPMPSTLGDFWRLLVERRCAVLVNLNRSNKADETVCTFWPTDNEEMRPVDFLVVRHVGTHKMESYEITTVSVEIDISKEKMSVTIVSMDNWKSEDKLPSSIEDFLTFVDAADTILKDSKRIAVTCYDGVSASGVFLAMLLVIEKMKLEGKCDVCLAVRMIRQSSSHFVATKEQFEYLFRASSQYTNRFRYYSYAKLDR